MKRALNVTISLCTAVLEQRNLAGMSVSVYPLCKVNIFVPFEPLSKTIFSHYMDVEMTGNKHPTIPRAADK